MVYQYAINISEGFKKEDYDLLLKIVSYERKKKADKYLLNKDKIQCIIGEALLRYALWKHFNLIDSDVVFHFSEYGKPYLVGTDSVYFNISHSGDWVFCGVGDSPLGVDVEIISQRGLKVAKRFFTTKEYRNILQEPLHKRYDTFTKLWTLKESYVKAVGLGLHISMKLFRFQFIENEIQLFVDEKRDYSYTFISNQLDTNHFCALCVKWNAKKDIYNTIKVLTIHHLKELTNEIQNL